MASRAIVPQQQQPRDGLKQKKLPVEGSSNRVLQDIGNLVSTRAAEGKQAAVEKNKKSFTEDASTLVQIGVGKISIAAKPVETAKNACEKPKPEGFQGSSRKSKQGTRKDFNAFSSVLSARSKAASGLTSKPKDLVVNIDAEDTDNELAVVKYIDELYRFYKLSEEENQVQDYMDNVYAKEQILEMEKAILMKLGWFFTVPTPYVFLVRYAKASMPSDEQMENMAFFLTELGLLDYTAATKYSPSILAASAVYAARCALQISPFWTETLKHHTGYSNDQLIECAELLVGLRSGAAMSGLKLIVVFENFSSEDHKAVALLLSKSSK